MATVIRYDAGTLQKPRRTPQGFLRVDGWASRCGVLEYRDGAGGGVRRELRLPEDVHHQDSLAGFEGLPVTDDHPSEMVSAENAMRLTRGTVLSAGRKDGDRVAISMIVNDPELIKKMDSGGKRQLSVGYNVELEEAPGEHPTYGKYDAIQRRIVPNHLAVVERGRAGDSVCVRMDGADAAVWVSAGKKDSAPDGYDLEDCNCDPEEDEDCDCSDEENYDSAPAQSLHDASSMPKSDGNDLPLEKSTMTLEEALAEIASLKAKLADFEGKAVKDADFIAEKKAEEAKATEEKCDAMTKQLAELEGQLASFKKDAEAEKAKLDQARKDQDDGFAALVKERVALESTANAILGSAEDRSGLSLRAIKVAIVKHVDNDDVGDERHDAYVDALYDGAVKRHAKGGKSVAAAAQAIAAGRADGSVQSDSGSDAEAKATAALKNNLSSAWMTPATKKGA